MQPNVITLAVDVANNGTPVDTDFTRFEEFQNRSVYVGDNHTLANRDQLSFYRTFPKASGNFPGVAKTAAKFTYDVVITGNDGVAQIVAPMIVEASFAFPVGTTAAQRLEMRQRAIALLDSDTIIEPLNGTLMV